VGSEAQNLFDPRNGATARYDQGYFYGLIGSRIRAFDWHQWPWMTLNGQNALWCTKMRLLAPTVQMWMKIDPYYQRQKCRPVRDI